MAMEKVVVGSDLGGLRELLDDGNSGYLVEADNAEALAERLWWLAEHEAERQQMGMQAKEFVVEQRDWRRVAELYFAVYDHAQHRT
jgi:glycosyltransferase involved in cell wall biosynthesis